MAARIGGEVILLLLPSTGLSESLKACERIPAIVAAHDWHRLAPGQAVTVSIGVTEVHAAQDPAQALKVGDDRLYKAKNGGRNQVCR